MTKHDAKVIAAALWLFAGPVRAEWKNVAGEWEQYKLNESQMQWFKSLKSRNGNVPCCNIADGHPTEIKRLEDGYWIPNPINPSVWMKVPDTALTTPKTNPIGVAVVWYVRNGEPEPQIRCFVPEAEG
jgi:hypothetical protein